MSADSLTLMPPMALLSLTTILIVTLACACGLEDRANSIARSSELLMVMRHFNISDLKEVNLGSYHNIILFLAEQDDK